MNTVQIKLIDFGFLAQAKETDDQNQRVVFKEFLEGTGWFFAPELLKEYYTTSNQLKYTSKVDVWGVGCMFCEMLTGYGPFA